MLYSGGWVAETLALLAVTSRSGYCQEGIFIWLDWFVTSNMPYAIRRKGSRYQVVNTQTGDVKAASTSRAKAERQLRLLKGLEKGWTAEGDDTYSRRVNGRKVTVNVTDGKGKGRGTQQRGKGTARSVDKEGERTGPASA